MPKANEIKKGMAVTVEGRLLLVKEIDVQSPRARGAATLYKIRFSDIRCGLIVEQRFKGDEIIEAISLERRPVSFSYMDGSDYVFMDDEHFTLFTFNGADIEEERLFIPEENIPGLIVLTMDDQALALELPQTVDLLIVDTTPSIKGASASARTKPATLSTGLIVQVPEYISMGERIKIHVQEHRFMSRAE